MRCKRFIENLPKIRYYLALELFKRGYPKIEIAKILKVSPSLVSLYLSGKRKYCCEEIERIVKETLKESGDLSNIYCKICKKLGDKSA